MANGKSKWLADWVVRRPVGREEVHYSAAPALLIQVCLDREVVQDFDWLEKPCHRQDMSWGNKACEVDVRGSGSIHLTAGNSVHSMVGTVANTVCASQSRPLHSSENTPPSHSMDPIRHLASPLLSVGDVDQSPVTNREQEGLHLSVCLSLRLPSCIAVKAKKMAWGNYNM